MEVKYVPRPSMDAVEKLVPEDYRRKKSCWNACAISLSALALLLTIATGALFVTKVFFQDDLEDVPNLEDGIKEQLVEIEQFEEMVGRLEQQEEEIAKLTQQIQFLQDEPRIMSVDSNPCQKLKDPGPCRAAIPRWHFDSKQEKCGQFFYGGCEGNGNNFQTLAECQNTCDPIDWNDVQEAQFDIQEEEGSPCQDPPDSGPCRDQLPRFYFDPSDLGCKKFSYGGCAGNRNNFLSEVECAEICIGIIEAAPVEIEEELFEEIGQEKGGTCESEPEFGGCQDDVERFYFSKSEFICKPFRWSGCGGNENNFATREKCETSCLPY